ncbi:hypothetical protein BD410DRAFT_752188 [Rickenella mellea]|uniref:Crinkler effector protein N-terminal domain-containing protein n=1 Tax=Rickenella mellea TaxID=50990 RepID=A0A4Y7PVU5_9AGAM|nr:hypothetical protein BD410DRAFT_752188 [Rickenella mellea]
MLENSEPRATIADMRLNCWVYGDDRLSIFPVGISQDLTVGHVRDAIKLERAALFNDMDACDIVLFKNSIPDDDDFLRHAFEVNYDPKVALRPTRLLRNVFNSRLPEEGHVHIFVRRPSTYGVMEPLINPTWSRREQTVKRLFECLESQRLVQIRGTPASGKSTLMRLLHAHIKSCQPDAIVQIVMGWPEESSQEHPIARFRRLIPGYPFPIPQKTFILFDNAHQTYWDSDLWEYFFKDWVLPGASYRVVLFCGYGSPSKQPVLYSGGTPPVLGPSSRISLWHRNEHGNEDDNEGFGLLLSRPEFDEYLANFTEFPLDPAFQDLVYEWTTGHAGAVEGIWHIVKNQNQNGTLEAYTIEDFFKLNPWDMFFSGLGQADFSRGLPTPAKMKDVNVSNVMRKLLKNRTIGTGEIEEEREAVRTCYENGWIQADLVDENIVYSFASPLHGVYISQQFTPTHVQIPHKTVAELTFDVVQRFKPSQLSGSAHVGTFLAQQPLAAMYQDEFYRRLGELVGDCVRISPKVLTADCAKNGSMDIFLPTQRWGIEITRDGIDLHGNDKRLGLHCAHGMWLTSSDMVDWILLDCCTEMPEDSHDDLPNLLHAVFTKNFSKVIILDNKLKELKMFALREKR